MSKKLQYEQVHFIQEMYRFTVFGLAEFTITKQQSTSGATLGFYVYIWVDLGFTHLSKGVGAGGTLWVSLVGALVEVGREGDGKWGKINPETPCNFGTPGCPVGPVSSSILYPFCGQCPPKLNTDISAPALWNELFMQTSRHPAIPSLRVYLRQTPWLSQRWKGYGGG